MILHRRRERANNRAFAEFPPLSTAAGHLRSLSDGSQGDSRYHQADSAIAFHGAVFKPIKQLRLLLTRSTCQAVKSSLEQRIGRNMTILVAPLNSIPRRIQGVKKRREWRHFVQALEDHDIGVRFVTDDRAN